VRVVELFCGIGGFRYGLEKSNRQQQENSEVSRCGDCSQPQSSESKQPQEWRDYTCVYANDNDKYACQIYRRHWENKELHEEDIRTVDPATIPEHDIICAGFPCQSFSIAGKRKGFEDTRGTLFFEICRIAKARRTPFLFLENVKGLLNHEEGKTFQKILSSLDELGYDCQWQVLNSEGFGVPQHRERVLIIGHLRGEPRPKVFPIGESNQDAPVLTPDRAKKRQNGRRMKEDGEPMFTLTGQDIHGIEIANCLDADGYLRTGARPRDENGKPQLLPIGYRRIRRLTPKECERLQGFPDNWTEKGIDINGKEVSISDTQRYKCLGNAVTTNVITAIASGWISDKRGGDG